MVATTATVDPLTLRQQLTDKLEEKNSEFAENTLYYESSRRPDAIGLAAPPELQKLFPHIGYPRLYVNALAERITPEGFNLPGSSDTDSDLWRWWTTNQLDVEFNLGCVEALVHGRAYVTISAPPTNTDPENPYFGPPDVPIIRVESPVNLFADVDPWTRRVTSAIRTYKNEDNDDIRATIYTPDATYYLVKEQDWTVSETVNHGLGIVPIVPLLNRTKLSDTHGTSEITPELRSFTDAAGRLLTNMQAAAELMGIPQRVIFGITNDDLKRKDGSDVSTFEAYMARILTVADPSGKVDQFQAAQLQNFADGIREIRNEVAAYTGLPPQYLSNAQDNPASADAIRSAERRLVLSAERKTVVFGGDLEEAMRVAWRVMNPGSDLPDEYYRLRAIFRNPATPTFESKADATSKLYANGQGVIPKERARVDLGYTTEEREEMRGWDAEQEAHQAELVRMYGNPAGDPEKAPTDESGDVSGSPGGSRSSSSKPDPEAK
ncbi:phage portal protein [Gordonia sp. X0973]|uniref:phage portal protein n=1 Tax=Gordonia sp. X0973 TaxID=2742602 RepID=UPI000F541FF3|nr:phage portal protein [Gordonia sp. X0973]QKT07930.1 phage portal protein [Gordonia sp. X0973]